jgi:ferric-dicitrate binding protein FerR (iron transport regulator)
MDFGGRRAALVRRCRLNQMVRMAQPLTTPRELSATRPPSGRTARAIVVGGAGFGVAAVLGASALWFHYGTAVFFETIASGISACF